MAFLLVWVGSALLIQERLDRRQRTPLAERLAPFQRGWVAELDHREDEPQLLQNPEPVQVVLGPL